MTRRLVSIVSLFAILLGSFVVPTTTIAQSGLNCAPLGSASPSPVAEIGDLPEVTGPTVPEGATEVTFGYLPVSIYAPVFVAYEKGYFAEFGLDVELVSYPGGTDMVLQAATGDLDLGIGGLGPAYWNAISQDLGLKVIAPGHSEGNPVATPLMISTASCEDGSITSVEDLRGKKVSVNAPGATEIWLARALETGGLTLDDIELQFLSFPDAVAALESGAIDAALVGEPLATAAELSGTAVRLAPNFDVKGLWVTAIFGNEEWIANNPDVAAGVVAAYMKASADLTNDFNDPMNLAIIQKYTSIDPALIAQSIKPIYPSDPTVDIESLTFMQEFFRERGQLEYDENLDPESIVDPAPGEGAKELLGS